MTHKLLFLVVAGLVLPQVVFAASCTTKGYTVIYINGILGSNESLKDDIKVLKDSAPKKLFSENITIEAALNPSALFGVDDLLKTIRQVQFWDDGKFHEDSDVDTILNQISSELTTQKVLLVGHSQGAFYANDIYYYLTTHGLSKDSVGVYAVATPANQVAGGGAYETSFNDSVIKLVRQDVIEKPYVFGVNLPLSANFVADISSADPTGHLFVPSYLDAEPNTIVSDIQQSLAKLEPTSDTDLPDGCFTPVSNSIGHVVAVFTGDHSLSTAEGIYLAGVGSAYGVGHALAWAGNAAASAYGAVAGLFGGGKENSKGEQAATFTFLHALNLTSISGKEAQELLSQDQGGAAVLAVLPTEAPSSTEGEVLGVATGTVSQEIAMGPTDASATPELSVPIPQPNPAAGLVSHGDSQGGSSAPAEIVLASDPDAGSPSSSGSSSDSATTSDDVASSTPSTPDPTPPADTTAPSIVSVSPAWGSIGVDAAVPLRIVYDEPIDAATINSGSVYLAHILIGFTGWEVFRTDVSLEADQKTIDITPLGPLVPSEYYSLVAGQTITDLAGNRAAALTAPVTNPQFQVATTSVVN